MQQTVRKESKPIATKSHWATREESERRKEQRETTQQPENNEQNADGTHLSTITLNVLDLNSLIKRHEVAP